jgi:DNA-binding GntR family transcriptional regulator
MQLKSRGTPTNYANEPFLSASQRAAEWIRSRIQEGTWLPGESIPSLDALAQSAGVSRFTMWKAVQQLKLANVLVTHRGGAIRVKGEAESLNQFRHQYIAAKISESILNGEYLPGSTLPPTAKLQAHFSACYTTVHRALHTLVTQKKLLRAGSRYIVPRLQTPGSALSVVFITENMESANLGLVDTIYQAEQLANKMGIHLAPQVFNLSSNADIRELQKTVHRSTIAGFILDFWGLGGTSREKQFNSLLSMLYAEKKPLAIIDHVNALALSEPYRSSGRIRVVPIGAAVAGGDVGRYLIRLGHRRATFITTSSDPQWSRLRLAGLISAFTDAGIARENVSVEFTTVQMGVAPAVCLAAGLSRGEMTVLFTPALSPEEFDRLYTNKSALVQRFHLNRRQVEHIRILARLAIAARKTGEHGPHADAVQTNLLEIIGEPHTLHFHEPLFDRLLADSSITAWVAATDGIGFAALSYLQNKKVSLPKQLSLVAFDNSLQSTARGLSTYDFDIAGLLGEALSIATNRSVVPRKSRRIAEWPGTLIVRQTSGKANSSFVSVNIRGTP